MTTRIPGSYPPRPGDLPRDELLAAARKAHGYYAPARVEVLFKFTCPHCGERCTLSRPDYLPENGECCNCGKVSAIVVGGFALNIVIGVPPMPNPRNN